MIYRSKGCRKRTEEKWQLHKAGVSPGCLYISVILVERRAFPAWALLTTWEPVADEKDPAYVIFTKPWYVRRGQRLWGMDFLVYMKILLVANYIHFIIEYSLFIMNILHIFKFNFDNLCYFFHFSCSVPLV